jgi:SAM-dependent methyltransferase
LLGAVATRRGDLLCLLTGATGEYADKFPQEQVVLGPAPEALPAAAPSPLRQLAEDLAGQRAPRRGGGVPLPDVRRGFRTAIASLAALLERRVEGVDVGHSAGARVLATPDGVRGDTVRADGSLVPAAALDDDRMIDSILRWSPVRADTFELRDRVRNLRLAPWREASGDGAPLRLAAARAALSRLDAAWALTDEPDGRPANKAADLLIASGGAFSVAPPPAVALALVDTLRRPGGLALFHDHARLLGPLGTLDSEADRRRLLADLLDDALLPLGSAILAIGLRPGRHAGTLRVTSDGAVTELELVPGTVQLVDLPPGIAATAELETREGAWLGVRARRIALDVAGGLGGLLVDTREIPLRLPERAERRRELLEAWQRPLWTGAEQ